MSCVKRKGNRPKRISNSAILLDLLLEYRKRLKFTVEINQIE
jgi:hypothetical protein